MITNHFMQLRRKRIVIRWSNDEENDMALKFRKLSHALGAEVCDVDLAQPMSQALFDEIHQAFLDYGILLFRNQDISHEQHIAFSRRFGELDTHDALPRDRHPDHKEIMVVTNEPKADGSPSDSRYIGRRWHTDMSFTLVPSLGSLLRCVTIPEVGGDTMFANTYLAYDTLSAGMKEMVGSLHGIHATGSRTVVDVEDDLERKRLNPPVAQPVVRVHPETGRKALCLGEVRLTRFDNMTVEESQPLITYLNRHATRPEFVYRHQWRKNDILAWDNRCTMHLALADFDHSQRRRMERTTILGTPSGYVVTSA